MAIVNYQIKGNLSEKQVESDVSGFFAWISKGLPFRLLDVDEQLTGADKKFFNAGFAFFMQYKISSGLRSVAEIPTSTRTNRSALEDIREFRNEMGLEDNPTLYFGLRRMAVRAHDFQHNILLKYANAQSSQAFYVAPLHLDKDVYYQCLFDSVNRFSETPFNTRHYKMYRKDWVSYIGHVPYLKEHISIIPHERVATHKHYYSYSQTGCEVGWHSPEYMSDGPNRLSDVLVREISNCINEEKFVDIFELAEMLEIGQSDLDANEQDPISKIQEWGKALYQENRICLYLLLGNRQLISRFGSQYT